MLVPELAAGAAPELDDLRDACAKALAALLAAGTRCLVIIGAGPEHVTWQAPVSGSFAAYGVPLAVSLERATALATRPLPESLLVASWLVRELDLDVTLRSVPSDLSPGSCASWRPDRFDDSQPWALLAMGDASACRTHKAPGYFDPAAQAFDDSVATALAAADTKTLLALDPAEAQRLWCAGRPVWQVLAGLVDADGRDWSGKLRYHDAPYGVGYLVASLQPGTDRQATLTGRQPNGASGS
jgi:hypothetical protein